MTTSQATMSFIDAQARELPDDDNHITMQPEAAPLKRRVHDAGVRHGKAFGSVGMVTTTYSKGFFEGFIASFKE